MSEGPMAAVSCITILTLVLLSLVNLILLISMIMESRRNCAGDTELADEYRFGTGTNPRRYSNILSHLTPKNQQHEDPKFMAALSLVKYNKLALVCGTTIIGRFWVLTTAQCCETVKIYSNDRIKIVSNSGKWRYGIKHDIEHIMRNSNFSQAERDQVPSHNVCLIKVRSPFTETFEVPVKLASSRYKYEVDTLATTLGWSLKKGTTVSDQLYFLQVNLISFERCKTLVDNTFTNKIDETMVCAYPVGKIDCNYDSGGPLVQNNVVIGIVSFETNCLRKGTPRVFTRMSYFEKWFELVEKQNNIKFGLVFNP